MSLSQITDPATHDAALTQATTHNHFIVIYVSSSASPKCIGTTPQIEDLAHEYEGKVQFYQMEITKDTQPMIKFSGHNCPILILMKGKWCETLLGGGVRDLRRKIEENL